MPISLWLYWMTNFERECGNEDHPSVVADGQEPRGH